MPVSFLRKCLWLVLPVAMLFAFPAFVLVVSGEYLPLESVATLQEHPTPTLFGPWTHVMRRYKRLVIERRRPDVLVLGASSAQQFRSAFFKDGKNFYNGAGAAACSAGSRFSEYLDDLPSNYHPSLIIAHFDYQCFDPDKYDTIHDLSWDDGGGPWGNFFKGDWKKIYQYVYDGKIDWQDLLRNLKGETYQGMRLMGLQAAQQHFGVRNDGSTRFGFAIEQESERASEESIAKRSASQILSGSTGYIYADHISTQALIDVRDFLRKARERGIFVIGVLPPYHPEIYAALRNSVRKDEYQRVASELSDKLDQAFHNYGFDFYDFGDVTALGGDASEMLDPTHGSEKFYLRLFIRMAAQSPVLNPYVDLPYLKNRLRASKDNFEVFYNEF